MYCVVANLRVKPEHAGDMARKLVEAAQTYRKDQGTLAWHVHRSEQDPNLFVIYERYGQKSDLDTHRANPYYSEFGKTIGPWLDGRAEITFLEELE